MRRTLMGGALLCGVLCVYALRLDRVGGLYTDDAYYVVLAKALSLGQGYALINSATGPILPGFPPGLPLLLAPVFAVARNYPENLLWLKLVSIVAMIGTGVLTLAYWNSGRGLGLTRSVVIAGLVMLLPGFVFLATSTITSECVFTCALMATAVALERAAREPAASASPRLAALAGLAATASVLIRAAGVVVVAGGAVFLLRRCRWQAAAVFAVVCIIGYAPWGVYAARHRPTQQERVAYGGDAVRGYGLPTPNLETARRALRNSVNVIGRDVGAMILPAGYRGAAESGLEVFSLTGARSLRAGSMGIGPWPVALSCGVAAFVMIGAMALSRSRMGAAEVICVLTFIMVTAGTSEAVYRYVLPLAPFVIGYFLEGVAVIARRFRADAGASAVRIAGACLCVLMLLEHGQYIWQKIEGPPPAWIRDAEEVRQVADFVNRQLPADASVTTTNPGLVYLLTGRKSVVYVDPGLNRRRWAELGIGYGVAMHAVPLPSSSTSEVLFLSAVYKLWVVRLGAPSGVDKN